MKLYKTHPTFIYNYRGEGYIAPPVSTFEKRSSRFLFFSTQTYSYPFETHYYHLMRFFHYELIFQRHSSECLFGFTDRENRLFNCFCAISWFYNFDIFELLYLLFIKVPPVLLHRLLS
jgi:hypothetical protein